MDEGIVYILTNVAMPGYIKIGKTLRDDLEIRIKELYTSGVPLPFELHYARKVKNPDEIEKRMHNAFSVHRENPKREFFKMEPERAVSALKMAQGEDFSIKEEDIYDKEDVATIDKASKIRPIFRFSMIGVPVGAEVSFTRDESIKAKVLDNNKIEYQGQEYSLSALAKILLNVEYKVAGTLYWVYNGKILNELRTEKESTQQDSED